jgi:translation initiation factor 2 alpha subunit (eIF-2alpha)
MNNAMSYKKTPAFFYSEQAPSRFEVVAAEITQINDDAVYAMLPAYGDKEVLIPTSEIYVKRHKKLTDYVKLGQLMIGQVIRVEGDSIDVSLKDMKPGETKEALDTFHRHMKVHNIIKTLPDVESIYSEYIWTLPEEVDRYAAFEEVRALEADEENPYEFPTALVEAIHKKMSALTYTADEEVTLRFGTFHDGVQRLNEELARIASLPNIQVIVIAPPKYKIVATDKTPARAAARLKEVVAALSPPC